MYLILYVSYATSTSNNKTKIIHILCSIYLFVISEQPMLLHNRVDVYHSCMLVKHH